uniref:Uncharacterized protein n=1 Tax=Anguilla anguilla TaxID=7936 RepID=A0A0E9TP32_ANGAN
MVNFSTSRNLSCWSKILRPFLHQTFAESFVDSKKLKDS